MKALIFGDIGGHADLFGQALVKAGCDLASGGIPDDARIIQVGDLVDRGPDSDGVINLVERFIYNPSWYQLIGNHEAQHLGGPQFDTPGSLSGPSDASIMKLRRWYAQGYMRVAAGLTVRSRDVLVTHAGLPLSFWNRMGQPKMRPAVTALNNMPIPIVCAPGEMLGEPGPPGPVWASVWNELIVPWYTAIASEFIEDTPFDQVHGHSTLFRWANTKTASPGFNGHPSMRMHMWYDGVKRHSSFNADGVNIMQCDPGFGKYASFVPVPIELEIQEEIA